jgi:hypothetical protein
MARNLMIFSHTTPTYRYNITDYEEILQSDFTKYGIGMSIYDEATNKSVLILPSSIGSTNVSYFSYTNCDVYQENSYCKNLGNGSFQVTIPRLVGLVPPGSYNFAMFIFKYNLLTPTNTILLNGVIDDPIIQDGVTEYSMIVIDYGSLEIVDAHIPILTDTERLMKLNVNPLSSTTKDSRAATSSDNDHMTII